MAAVETREQRDRRIEVVGQARLTIIEQQSPRTALVNGETVEFFCKWVVYLSELLDRATLPEQASVESNEAAVV